MLYLALLVQISMHLLGAEVLLLDGVVGVVAVKGRNDAVVNLDDFRGNLVQKIAVVGDNDYCAFVV